MEVRGVLDRIEDGIAIILVEEDGFQFIVPARDLPKGSKVGAYFECSFDEKGIDLAPLNEKYHTFKRGQAEKLMKKLRARFNKRKT